MRCMFQTKTELVFYYSIFVCRSMTLSTTSFFPSYEHWEFFSIFLPNENCLWRNQGADVQFELTNNQSVCMMHMKARCSLKIGNQLLKFQHKLHIETTFNYNQRWWSLNTVVNDPKFIHVVPTLPAMSCSVVKSSVHGLSIFITPDQLTLASTSTHWKG